MIDTRGMRTLSLSASALFACLTLLAGCSFPSEAELAAAAPAETAAIAVGIDTTATFRQHQKESVELVKRLAVTASMDGGSIILLHTVDSSSRYLKRIEPNAFISRKAMELIQSANASSASVGTDIVGFIESAAERLNSLTDEGVNRRIIMLFSDGVVDPIKDASGVRRQFRPISELSKETLEGISLRVYFVSPEAKREFTALAKATGADIKTYEPGDMNDYPTLEASVRGAR